jgi:tetrahydromethanopterin S-methyltransferase subunit A
MEISNHGRGAILDRTDQEGCTRERGKEAMKLKIYEDRCSGCGICVDTCPQRVFASRRIGDMKIAMPVAEKECSGCRTCEQKCPERAIEVISEIAKVKTPEGYPPEEGHFLRGNDYSSVAVAALLNSPYGEVPVEVENIVGEAIECGAALVGALQTGNVGIEKIIANIVANPNIRYLIICGKDIGGHMPGDALRCLANNGVDSKRRIVGTNALKPYLLNISMAAIDRFMRQITILDLTGVEDPTVVKKAVWACYQEKPTPFRQYTLSDVGAYPGLPICEKVKWRITRFDLLDEEELQCFFEETGI